MTREIMRSQQAPNKEIQGMLTPYQRTEVAEVTVPSLGFKRLLRGTPDLSRWAASTAETFVETGEVTSGQR